MVLTAQFWFEISKRQTNLEFVEKIIRNEVIIVIWKDLHLVNVSYSNYPDKNGIDCINDMLEFIKGKIKSKNSDSSYDVNWFIRENDLPSDLSTILKSFNFTKLETNYKMGIDLLVYNKMIKQDEVNFKIVNSSYEDLFQDRLLEFTIECHPNYFKTKEDVISYYKSYIEKIKKLQTKAILFIAYTLDQNIPIASASMEVMKDLKNVAYLNGAFTDKNNRYKGLYTDLLFKRIKFAKEIGVQYIIVDANPLTSAPILEKFGFKIFDKYDIYRTSFPL